MYKLLINEFKIILSKKKYLIFYFIILSIAVLTTIGLNKGLLYHNLNKFDYVNYILNISLANVLILCFCLILSSEIFGYDYNKGTIKNLMMLPIAKINILFSKILTIIIYLISQYVVLFIYAIITNAMFENSNLNFSYIFNYFLQSNLIPIIASILICLFLIIYTKSISISTIIPIVLYFIGNVLSNYLPANVEKFYIYSYFNPNYLIPNETLAIILSLCYIFIFSFLFIYKFKTDQFN